MEREEMHGGMFLAMLNYVKRVLKMFGCFVAVGNWKAMEVEWMGGVCELRFCIEKICVLLRLR